MDRRGFLGAFGKAAAIAAVPSAAAFEPVRTAIRHAPADKVALSRVWLAHLQAWEYTIEAKGGIDGYVSREVIYTDAPPAYLTKEEKAIEQAIIREGRRSR